jgi:hypothetical protein
MNQPANISIEQNQLVNILQRMYDDNIRQINGMTSYINNIRNTNTQIRNTLIQILNRSNRNQFTDNHSTRRNNVQRERVIPYVFDYSEYYRLPSTTNRNTRTMQNFLEPVEVYPTQAQIEIATRNVQYCNILNPINRSCPISLETFNDTDMVVLIRFCGHIFKPEQIRTWFRSNCRCPVCRYDIRSYNSNNSTNNEEIPLVQSDISGNFVEENESSNMNEERTNNRINTIENYIDLIFESVSNDTNIANNTLLNDITNIVDTTDANAILTLFSSALRRNR